MSLRALRHASLIAVVASCSGDPAAPPEATYSIAIRAGSAQQGPAGSELPQPLQVTVTNVAMEPVQGVVVSFRALDGEGEVTDGIGVTGLGGIAHTFVRLGPEAGPQRFQASLRRAPEKSVTFDVAATPPAVLTRIEPSTFIATDEVLVYGENFNIDPLGNAVFFGNQQGRILALEEDGALRVMVPACVAPGPVQVHVEIGSARTNAVQATYGASTPIVLLPVGQGLTVRAAELDQQCLLLASGSATGGPRYLIVPQFASIATTPMSTQFRIGRTTTLAAHVAATAPPPAPPQRPQQRIDQMMRGLETEIAPMLAGQGAEPGPVPLEALELDSRRSFRVISDLGDPGESPEFETANARLRFIGEHILIYVDEEAPATLSAADLAQVGTLFDDRLYEIAVSTFGSESDLDANGKVIVLMSPSVNGLVTRAECTAGGFIAGYFYPNDLFLRNANSNRGEVFYTIVPDPAGTISCQQTISFVKRFVPTTFIHELQHMISFNQHVLARGGSTEDVWLNEGLSLIAEEKAGRFYEERDIPPPGAIFPDSAAMFLLDIMVNAYDYLFESRGHSITTFADFGSLPERGGAWLFLRWLGDQKGEDIFGRLVQTRLTSVENVQEQGGESFQALFGDFAIAAAADISTVIDRNLLDPRYRFERDFRTIFDFVQARFAKPFPSPVTYTAQTEIPATPALVASAMVDGTMAFYSFRTSAIVESAVALRFTTASLAPFDPLLGAQVGIIRVR